MELKAPQRKRALRGISLWAVWAHEPNPPAGVKALDWMLLTTVGVNDFDEALARLGWYRRRWGIEVYHRTLKSGCRIEERQLGAAERIGGVFGDRPGGGVAGLSSDDAGSRDARCAVHGVF